MQTTKTFTKKAFKAEISVCVVQLGNAWIDLWHKSIMHCPSHFLFTTPRSERGDRVQWILIDSFGFPEIISPRMHQGNWISNYPSPLPCLSLCLPLQWGRPKPHMNCCILDHLKVFQWCHRVTPSYVSDNRGWNQRRGILALYKLMCAMSGSVPRAQTLIWFADAVRRKSSLGL